jgi:hypothetical protein
MVVHTHTHITVTSHTYFGVVKKIGQSTKVDNVIAMFSALEAVKPFDRGS